MKRLKNSGFSLLETLITVAIAAILLMIAVPDFTGTILDNRRATSTNRLLTHLNLARSEAIKRSRPISLCKSDDGISCGNAGVNWHHGWLVFVNLDNDRPAEIDPGEPLLQVYEESAAVPPYDWDLLKSGVASDFITFRPNGAADASATLTYCDNRGANQARAIVINATGRPAVVSPSDVILSCN